MVRTAFEAAARALLGVLDDQAVGDAWDQPSALEQMTVGALAAHAGRAVSTVLAYLDTAEPSEGEVRSPAGYVFEVLGDEAQDAPLHQGIRARAVEGAGGGPGVVADRVRTDLDTVLDRLATTAADHQIAVKDGIVLTLDDYLATRIVELVVHLDDLGASVDDLAVAVPDNAAAVAIEVLADLARLRHGWQHVVRHLARRERAVGLVAAL